jgi:PAS domain S-box-containing protein
MIMDYQIIDAIDASIYWKDLSGKYLGCNKYMEKMAGLSRDEILGNTDEALPWKNNAKQIQKIDQLVVANNKKYLTEEDGTLVNDIVKTFLSSKKPLIGENGKIIGTIGVSVDITDYKRFEHEFEKTDFYFDQTLMTPVINNLIMNAISYSPKDKKITISMYKSYLRNTEIPAVLCRITDEVIGGLAGEVESIFDSFHLLESSQDLDSKLSKPNYSLQRINDLLVISTYKLEQKVKLLKQTNAI